MRAKAKHSKGFGDGAGGFVPAGSGAAAKPHPGDVALMLKRSPLRSNAFHLPR